MRKEHKVKVKKARFWFVYLKNFSDNVNETFNFYIDDVDVDDDADADDHMTLLRYK